MRRARVGSARQCISDADNPRTRSSRATSISKSALAEGRVQTRVLAFGIFNFQRGNNMSFSPLPPYGVGGSVNATISTTIANQGASPNFANSPNTNGLTSTAERLLTVNSENIGTTVPSNAGTT